MYIWSTHFGLAVGGDNQPGNIVCSGAGYGQLNIRQKANLLSQHENPNGSL